MAYGYTGGTITLANGVSAVTGVATGWGGGAILPGDTLWRAGVPAIVDAVASNTALTLRSPWTGSSYTGSDYFVQHTSSERHDVSRLSENFARWYRSAPYPIDTIGAPDNAVGVDGWTAWDWTTNPANPVVYRKTGGAWGSAIPLRGTIGAQGPTGASGGTVHGQNLLINGGFVVNQRNYANGTPLAVNQFCRDRWFATVANTSISVSGFGVVTLSAGGEIAQVVEGSYWDQRANYNGPLTFSADTPASQLTITANNVSGVVAAGAGLQSVTLTPTTGPNVLVKIKSTSGAAVTFRELKIERGTQATSYLPRGITIEKQMCQRYYQKSYADTVAPGANNYFGARTVLAASATLLAGFDFVVPMRVGPALTVYAPSGEAGSARLMASPNTIVAVTATQIGQDSVKDFAATGLVAPQVYQLQYVAEAELTS